MLLWNGGSIRNLEDLSAVAHAVSSRVDSIKDAVDNIAEMTTPWDITDDRVDDEDYTDDGHHDDVNKLSGYEKSYKTKHANMRAYLKLVVTFVARLPEELEREKLETLLPSLRVGPAAGGAGGGAADSTMSRAAAGSLNDAMSTKRLAWGELFRDGDCSLAYKARDSKLFTLGVTCSKGVWTRTAASAEQLLRGVDLGNVAHLGEGAQAWLFARDTTSADAKKDAVALIEAQGWAGELTVLHVAADQGVGVNRSGPVVFDDA